MLVRNFATASGRVYYLDKNKPDARIEERNPSSILAKPHLYSTIDKAGRKDASQELAYSRLESDAAPILQKVIIAARTRELPSLTKSEKECVDAFLFEQWRRVPELRESLMTAKDLDGMLDGAVDALRERLGREPSYEVAASLSDPSFRERVLRNAKVGALNARNPSAMAVLDGRGLAVALAPSGKSFVLGSRPVVKLCPPDTNDLRDHRVELWLPISHDVAITPGGARGTEHTSELSGESIRRLNRVVWRSSTKLVSSSLALLTSLANQR
ncbi:hypothetical protein ASC68_19405 [Devosia sp. Root105]|nr:hypothetical protein ASC68_19405 [Devosia sp. Root105]